MAEGSLYDRELAALAIKQARGDLIEAIFLVRAYRTTLPRFGATRAGRHRRACSPRGASRRPSRTCRAARCSGRPSTTPTACSISRLPAKATPPSRRRQRTREPQTMPRVTDILGDEGLIEPIAAGRRRSRSATSPASRSSFPGRPRPAAAEPGARRRGLSAGARLFDPARLWPQPSVRRRDPLRRGRGRVRRRRSSASRSRSARSRSPNARWSTSSRARRPRRRRNSPAAMAWPSARASARRWRWRWSTARCAPRELGEEVDRAGAGRGVRAVALRQRPGDRLRRAPEAAALCRLPGRARPDPRSCARSSRRGRRRRAGRCRRPPNERADAYNFAYLDEQTKRMIRRAILKAIAIPGYQVPFASREMPMPYGWGTGGVQVTAAIIGPDDVLKVIDQGADDTTNAVSIRNFFAKTAGVATTDRDGGRDHHPDAPPHSRGAAARRPDPGLPGADPRAAALPRAARDRDAHACTRSTNTALMHVKLYEDIARFGHIATTYDYPVKVERPLRDGPVADAEIRQSRRWTIARRCSCSAPAARSASTRSRPTRRSVSLDFEDHPFEVLALRRALRALRRRRRLSRRGRHRRPGRPDVRLLRHRLLREPPGARPSRQRQRGSAQGRAAHG